MGAYAWRIDPSGTVYNLTDNTNTFLTAQEVPPPPTAPQFISSRDVDGDALVDTRYGNRTVTLGIRVVGSSQADIEDRTQLLQAAITKLHREGGVLEGTSPAGTVFYLDVLDAQITIPQGKRYMQSYIAEPVLEFTCKPFIYGTENTPSDHVETSSPCLIFTEASVAGDVPALGRLVIDEDEGADQAWMVWGLRSKNYSNAATASLYYDAVGRTAQGGGATTSTAASGYSGSGSVLAGSLSTEFESILSTRATGGGSHLTHIGAYRVFARWQPSSGNTGLVSVALEWGVGDFRSPTQNATTYLTIDRTSSGTAAGGSWLLVDHGIIRVPTGAARWEGRFLAKSTALNDDVHLDHFFLVPVDEGYGEARGITPSSSPTAYTARDDFSSGTYSGDVASDTLPTGGTWGTTASPYEAGDFVVTGGFLTRTTASDASTDIRYGRIVYPSGTTGMTSQTSQVEINLSGIVAGQGLVGRIVDKDNFLALYYVSSTYALKLVKVVSGTVTVLSTASAWASPGLWARLTMQVTAGGVVTVTALTSTTQATLGAGGTSTTLGPVYDSVLATGGALASGYCGVVDWNTSVSTTSRTYDNFAAWVPVTDAAAFASQSIQVKYDGVTREDSGGTFWQNVSDYAGDYILVPPAGRESRTSEFFVKMTRNDPTTGADSAIDNLSAKAYVTSRWLTVPT